MGPVERLVAGAVARATDTDPAKVLRAVETTRAKLGDVTVDLRELQGVDPEWLGGVLGDLPYVERVLPVLPRLYLRLADGETVGTVVAGVLADGGRYGDSAELAGRTVAVASADPNLNKALHVGHLRNAALGMVVANLFETAGATVRRTCMESDWGPHIAEAVVGYLRWGGGATPASAGERPGEFVGRLYARYHQARRDGDDVERDHAELVARMVAGDPEAGRLVGLVTGWAAEGIHALYARVGVRFDEVRRERATLPEAREILATGVRDGVFGRRDDGSVFVDLASRGLPEMTLVRGNGLPVSYPQWLAVDYARYGSGELDRIVQLDGAEWQSGNLPYEAILDLLDVPWKDRREVAYYGMVNGAKGRKLGSRSGEALTADALLDQVGERLRDLLADPDGGRLPADVAEDTAVALVTFGLLRRRRIDPLVLDERTLFGTVLPELVALLRLCEPAARSGGPPRPLAMELNETPRVLSRALAELDGVSVVRHLGYLARHAGGCELTGDLAAATATAVRKGLAVLNVRVPDGLRGRRLPPEHVLRRRAS